MNEPWAGPCKVPCNSQLLTVRRWYLESVALFVQTLGFAQGDFVCVLLPLPVAPRLAGSFQAAHPSRHTQRNVILTFYPNRSELKRERDWLLKGDLFQHEQRKISSCSGNNSNNGNSFSSCLLCLDSVLCSFVPSRKPRRRRGTAS